MAAGPQDGNPGVPVPTCRIRDQPFVAVSTARQAKDRKDTDMTATIAVHEFISADGVFESPTWTFEFGWDPRMGETLAAITDAASTILLGRKTHEMFAPAWRDRTVEDDPGADFFNHTEKLVVGAEEPAEEWGNTTRLGAYDADVIRRLKDERDGVIYISGSGQLVRQLVRDGLVDDLHLFVYPVALGEGERFWAEGEQTKLSLKTHDVYDNGVVHLCYAPTQGSS
jgi:dihydrofolate reductase